MFVGLTLHSWKHATTRHWSIGHHGSVGFLWQDLISFDRSSHWGTPNFFRKGCHSRSRSSIGEQLVLILHVPATFLIEMGWNRGQAERSGFEWLTTTCVLQASVGISSMSAAWPPWKSVATERVSHPASIPDWLKSCFPSCRNFPNRTDGRELIGGFSLKLRDSQAETIEMFPGRMVACTTVTMAPRVFTAILPVFPGRSSPRKQLTSPTSGYEWFTMPSYQLLLLVTSHNYNNLVIKHCWL